MSKGPAEILLKVALNIITYLYILIEIIWLSNLFALSVPETGRAHYI
jgi:hypothetical protein